ncbi:deoxyribodipyrimidine photo-lyase isoform X1 [Agrilus planipennis]|uniref:Deoxyribodipyrimidine photo-lyase n=2 Tax=Agrilus planipennis TaxID=224129 RepID=A0A1W4WHL5_AGRPL|nr:deoxyribodipyrimidine photo-lyase isoform X1 [Agrilus planipennis]
MASITPRVGSKVDWTKFTKENFISAIKESRSKEGERVEDFKFNKNRIRILSDCKEVKESSDGILYWMCRDCRVQDNWAMLFAQRLARKNKIPLFVCYFTKNGSELVPTRRHNNFLINGLKEVAEECSRLNIKFHLINGDPCKSLVDIVIRNNIGSVICELNPLRKPKKWQQTVKGMLPNDVSLVQVDAHNIVPVWITSSKQELAARTIRPKINRNLEEYLTGFPMVSKHEYAGELNLNNMEYSFEDAIKSFESEKDVDLPEIKWAKPSGTTAGIEMLHLFLTTRLKNYATTSGDPSKDNLSRMSSWVNFGQLSAQRIALEVENFKNSYKESVERYLEELIVRRELSDNYCFYNENYDNIEGADKWARTTLDIHRKDKREYIYTKEQFAQAKTHDEIWNAAQVQVINEGRMHGYIRMYWCKKILEWTKSPEEAIEIGLHLNDTFALDGNNPNGFVGVMWSICGVHDHGWTERPIFGKIRFMVFWSMRKKFDADAFCEQYGRRIDNATAPKAKKQSVSNIKQTYLNKKQSTKSHSESDNEEKVQEKKSRPRRNKNETSRLQPKKKTKLK